MRPMKSMFNQSRRSVPSLNVASMPDLIFTVLFFFMIVTHMRSDEVKVRLHCSEPCPRGAALIVVELRADPAPVLKITADGAEVAAEARTEGDALILQNLRQLAEHLVFHHAFFLFLLHGTGHPLGVDV